MSPFTASYIDFVSNYFNTRKERVLQELEENNIDIEYLKSILGPLTRSLSSLEEVKNDGTFDCIVKILAVSRKVVEKVGKTFIIFTLLVADQYSICKLSLFDNEGLNVSLLKENREIRLHEVYYEKVEEFDDVLKLKRGGNIFPVIFSVPGFNNVRTPIQLSVDGLGEYVSDPKHVSYIQELGIIHVKGVLKKEDSSETYYLVDEQFKIGLRLKDELKIFVDNHCLDRIIAVTFVRIRYGRDSLYLVQTEFSKFLITNYNKVEIDFTNLMKYEYPAQIMSLREMLDTGLVALPSVAISYMEERETEDEKKYLLVYIYDSTALVRLYIFEDVVIKVFLETPLDKKFRILSGIYKKTMRKDPRYINVLPVVNIRVKDDIIEMIGDDYEPTVTLLKNIVDYSQPVVTEGIIKGKEEIKSFYYKDNSMGYKMTFTIEQQGVVYRITTFNKRDANYLESIGIDEKIKIWWVNFNKDRYIVKNYGRIELI